MIKKLLIIVLIATGIYSCTDDLNTEPVIEQSLENLLASDPDAALGILARLYGGFVLHGTGVPGSGDQEADIAGDDPGETVWFRSMWNMQELTTDIVKNRWGDGGLDPLTTATGWVPTNKFFGYIYNRSYFNIAQVNNFVLDVQKAGIENADQFVAEARFIRAITYYYLMDMFGGVVKVTEADGVTGVLKAKEKRADIFKFIEEELLAIESIIPANNDYGRANRAAVHMALAKIYLNAEVYTGSPQYDKALTYSEKVITESSFSLDADYQSIFQGDNYMASEIIFPLIGDRSNVQSFGNSTYLTNASLGDTTMPIGDFGNSEGWFGNRCTPALYSLFGDLSTTADSRAIFWTSGHNYEMADYKVWEDGYPTTKFQNAYASGSSVESRFSDTDIPLFRLSDAYLMYAEAHLQGGGGTIDKALGYINALRERAYGNASGNIDSGELTLDFIIDERARELYYEGHRRQDLIRFGLFTGGDYVWPWKGNVAEGTSIPSHYNVFPFPLEALQANPLLEQNPEYPN
ncbi:RagB/SusD family nutrient uptake outer membrane protein [Snuella sedimenti]|uniref:RagB/SusD family nutrient uptake outer membrane protein n=1 Tax=Snuella sedimenti TaxID=2798802 RepID=A0A8J7LYF4_9FLAO|nr:RagB/SusD family nutrient uptake outer membrane protein [Snuella sedimenti]MBJ6368276.1 RagB/SusD family nutrient uptake outer membrane protein [Snuella sedimenti]